MFQCYGLVSLDETDPESLLTQDKDRIYTKVTVTDHAGSVTANLTEKATHYKTSLECFVRDYNSRTNARREDMHHQDCPDGADRQLRSPTAQVSSQ